MMSQAVRDLYRCPDGFLDFALGGELSSASGYFRFGPAAICYGRSSGGAGEQRVELALHDAFPDTVMEAGRLGLPFDPTEIVDNLRMERYPHHRPGWCENLLKKAYYWLRPLTNRSLRKRVQKFHGRNWQKPGFPRWPVDTTVEDLCETLLLLSLRAKQVQSVPFVWFWPRGASGCVLMTHDVETEAGRDFCRNMLELDDSYGIKASFQIVPQDRYTVPASLLETIRNRGFEIGVQDLNHDGRLFDEREEFLRRAEIINKYGREYRARGFRAGVLYRNPEWYGALDFSFDMSIPNVAHLDPQRGGCCTVMPYFIGKILELPVTTIQDYTLFHILNQHSTDLWKRQIELILGKHGLAHFIVHPDYMIEPECRLLYERLLGHLEELRSRENVWIALPSQVDGWWRERSKMRVVEDGASFRIEGEGAGRAVLAFAREVNGRLVYEVGQANTAAGA